MAARGPEGEELAAADVSEGRRTQEAAAEGDERLAATLLSAGSSRSSRATHPARSSRSGGPALVRRCSRSKGRTLEKMQRRRSCCSVTVVARRRSRRAEGGRRRWIVQREMEVVRKRERRVPDDRGQKNVPEQKSPTLPSQ
ncbi:hypothetical protein BRADI_2g14986v3 [Brachypodium distachyon]|uniref:Uncharacterized protein n=1 Tax=Brachypodium distachyon TaxID=15368 RepID=A0A0Q3FZ56_BRADI|nr:hypothetical protein BRADI_2g14986v3 [Brachypodium distachyon]